MVAFRVVLMVLAGLACLAGPAEAAKPKKKKPPPPLKVQLLSVNDFHGHLEPTQTISRTGDPLDRVPAGGAEYLAANLRKLRARMRHTVFVASGDLIGGSPLLSSLFHDEPSIEMFNKLGLWVSSVGNHEFDEGQAELLRMQHGGCHPDDGCGDGNGFTGAKFRYLAANVTRKSDGKPFFPPYAIRKIQGVKIGFIGETTKLTPHMISPTASAGLRFRDEAQTANHYARVLKHKGVRAIVLLLHEGGRPAKGVKDFSPNSCPSITGRVLDIIRETSPAVDLFLTGHSHVPYNCVIGGRRVTSAGAYGRLITRVKLQLSRRTGEVQHIDAYNWVVGQDVPPAPDMTAMLARYDRIAGPMIGRLVGRLAHSAGRGRDRSGQSRMGSLVADAQRQSTGAAAAFVNGGMIRAGLPRGDITYGRAFTSQPFGTSLVTLTLSGSQIHELLRQQWCGRASQNILMVSAGVTYSWSRSAAKLLTGAPCDKSSADPIIDLRINGIAVQPWMAFRVTVNSSVGGGGGGFGVLHGGRDPVDGSNDVDALADYLGSSLTGPPIEPPVRDRITRVP
jgi:5'-nucleotidase